MNKYLEKVAEMLEKEASKAGVARALVKKHGTEEAGAEEIGRLFGKKHAKSIDNMDSSLRAIAEKSNKAKREARQNIASGKTTKSWKTTNDSINRASKAERKKVEASEPLLHKGVKSIEKNFSKENMTHVGRGAREEYGARNPHLSNPSRD